MNRYKYNHNYTRGRLIGHKDYYVGQILYLKPEQNSFTEPWPHAIQIIDLIDRDNILMKVVKKNPKYLSNKTKIIFSTENVDAFYVNTL